jgi:sulfite exporter TauE/SafE
MNDITVTFHNLESLLEGKSSFNDFMAGEGALIEKDIASLDAVLQPAVRLLYHSFKVGASSLVGAGLTAIGPVLAQSADTQATQILNILQALGVPTAGVLRPAEQAALVTVINGLKAGLDKIGIQIATNGAVNVAAAGAG